MSGPRYEDFLSRPMQDFLLRGGRPVDGVPGLVQIGASGGLETKEALKFLVELCRQTAPDLHRVLEQRRIDREFLDQRTRALYAYNQEHGLDVGDDDYQTVLGLEDKDGRIVAGPLNKNYWTTTPEQAAQKRVAPLPEYLQGPHVTLFGPPDNAKMCVNAMNAYHRRLKGEPAIVEELLQTHTSVPKWGADDEDSKTPIREDFISAGENLTQCFEGTLQVSDDASGKRYALERDKLSLPIKRFPGLALPCSFLYCDGAPVPLHLYDFALHFFRNWARPEALTFYVPKLENEEEARYLHGMLERAEDLLRAQHPEYQKGTIRLMIVLENPRAAFRAHEIMDELHPYFAGASLGWHDFLASTARLFKEDGNYRIPIKADPDIVIKYIKASHELLARAVGPRGGIKIGGMYGILPLTNDLRSESFQVTIKGYIRDVVTQFKRDLDGFWVAHPDFVRLGLALVEAWRIHQAGDSTKLRELVCALLDPKHQKDVLDFIFGPDIESLNAEHPRYPRSLIVADLKASKLMPNNAPEEVRYNVFQSLQYLADWLSGNGCVALPTQVGGVAVRVMDDLATAERSRWEVWHELRHGRFALEDFLRIAHEEMHFIRKDLSDGKKIVQVKWDERTAKWYPVALRLMLKLMTDKDPVEFATALLLPFTMDSVRNSDDPWATVAQVDPARYRLDAAIERFNLFFECCGHQAWASTMAAHVAPTLVLGERIMRAFELDDINEAASFHGNIGEAKKTLDARASAEQAKVFADGEALRQELLALGEEYRKKFGMKFLVSAQGRTGTELLAALKARLLNSPAQELENARLALWEITRKRLATIRIGLRTELEGLLAKHQVRGAQIALTRDNTFIETIALGEAREKTPVTPATRFEAASLSKPVAAAFACEYFRTQSIPLSTSVNALLAQTKSRFRLKSADGQPAEWADRVTVAHLLRHEALNLHYVNGVPADRAMPPITEFLDGNSTYGYEPVRVTYEPGASFHYSGAGFLVLEHLLEALEGQPVAELTRDFTRKLGMKNFTFDPRPTAAAEADGFADVGARIEAGRKMFPALAAGALCDAESCLRFLTELTESYRDSRRHEPLSHDTAREMLHGIDRGSCEFMAARMGLGIFVTDAGLNKLALHQGANDGFRALFVHCYAGPNRGQGFVLFANGELNAVHFIADAAKLLLRELDFVGIDFTRWAESFETKGLKPEEIVNRGYKDLVFNAFERLRPEAIPRRGALDPLAKFNRAVGAQVLTVTNDLFARAENLVDPHLPRFEVDLYGDQGKVMDSWESVRHNPRSCDELVLKLLRPVEPRFVAFSTAYHFGNQVPAASLEGLEAGREAAGEWIEILPRISLEGHATKKIRLEKKPLKFSQIKVKVYPDGGLSRLAIFDDELPAAEQTAFKPALEAKSVPVADPIPQPHKPLVIPYAVDAGQAPKLWAKIPVGAEFNNASPALGAHIVSCSNQHYSPASQVLSPYPPLHMFDGFESARSREPGHQEEFVLALAHPRAVHRIEFNFSYFVNNNPRALRIEGLTKEGWKELAGTTEVKAFAASEKHFQLPAGGPVITQLRVFVIPDGGINRIRVFSLK